jgi:hypothetical protein
MSKKYRIDDLFEGADADIRLYPIHKNERVAYEYYTPVDPVYPVRQVYPVREDTPILSSELMERVDALLREQGIISLTANVSEIVDAYNDYAPREYQHLPAFDDSFNAEERAMPETHGDVVRVR